MVEPANQSLSVPSKKKIIKRQLSDHRGSIHYAAVREYVYDEIIYPALKRLEKERSEMNKKAISEMTIRDVVEDMAPPPPKVPTNKVVEDMSKKDEGKLNATPINIDINANNKKQEDEDENRRHRKRSFCICC